MQRCVITGLPAGHLDACMDCDPCTDPNCWTEETERQRVEWLQELDRMESVLKELYACPYCHDDGVERIVGWDNDVIEQPCSRGCPTPMQRQTEGRA